MANDNFFQDESFPDNPYQTPKLDAELQKKQGDGQQGEIRPTAIEIGKVLQDTWEIFQPQMLMCAVAVFVVGLINQIPNIPNQVAQMMAESGAISLSTFIAINISCTILSFLLNVWLVTGQGIFMLRIARGGNPDLMDLFSGGFCYFPQLIATFLLAVANVLIILVMVGPGLIALVSRNEDLGIMLVLAGAVGAAVATSLVALFFWPYWYLILDRRAFGPLEGLQLGLEYTSGNRLASLALFVVFFFVMVAGMIAGFAMCCVGILITMPLVGGFGSLMFAVTYLAMTGQPNAVEQWKSVA